MVELAENTTDIQPCRYCGPNMDRVELVRKDVLDGDAILYRGYRWQCGNCGWGMPAAHSETEADSLWNDLNA